MTALHRRIAAEIEGEIRSGALAPGARLPVEHALQQRYGCARMTVSKALGELARRGLVERRKRAGTFVARPRVHATVLDIPDLAQEVAARGQRYRYRCTARAVRADDGAGLGPRVLAIAGVHEADGLPIAVEERLVGLEAVPAIVHVAFDPAPPGSWLLEHVPWTDAETRVAAEAADDAVARALGVDAGTACLVIERRTWRAGIGVTWVRQHFLGTAYDLVARVGGRD